MDFVSREQDDEELELEQGMDCDGQMVQVVEKKQVLEQDGQGMEVGLRVVLDLVQGLVVVLEQPWIHDV